MGNKIYLVVNKIYSVVNTLLGTILVADKIYLVNIGMYYFKSGSKFWNKHLSILFLHGAFWGKNEPELNNSDFLFVYIILVVDIEPYLFFM